MRIQIQTEGKSLYLPLPSGLVLNPLTVLLTVKALEKKGLRLSGAQAAKLVNCINEYRKSHPEWVLAQVHSSDGDEVFIML